MPLGLGAKPQMLEIFFNEALFEAICCNFSDLVYDMSFRELCLVHG
jgi:hypothetical protein